MPSLSILIITYNRPEDTLDLLKSLAKQQDLLVHVKEILLLNNASTESYKVVEDFIAQHPELPVNLINHVENLGVARGRNYLIDLAKGEVLMVLDDDVVFKDNNAIMLAATMFQQEQYILNNTAVITMDIFYYANHERQISAFPHKDFKKHEGKDWFLTYYFTGAAHLMKRELFKKTGLYPTDFFYGMEEYDLSYRIIDAGYTLAYDSQIKILHKESPEGRVTNSQKLGMMWLNKSKVAWRYLPKQYFYSTALMWALEYLKKSKFDVIGMCRNYSKVFNIPKIEKRTPISERSLKYLKDNNARLWY